MTACCEFGGLGHTCCIYSKDDARIRQYARRMPAFRVLVNTPAPQGSTGITTNVFPSMTLGCGAVAGNITSDNVGPQHLINIKRLAYAVRKPKKLSRCSRDTAAGRAGRRGARRSQASWPRSSGIWLRGIAVALRAGARPTVVGAPMRRRRGRRNVAAAVGDRFLRRPPMRL